jgi:hypothetical protein
MDNNRFKEWMDIIKDMVPIMLLSKGIKLNFDQIPDQPYSIWYDAGLTPYEAAARALKNAGIKG